MSLRIEFPFKSVQWIIASLLLLSLGALMTAGTRVESGAGFGANGFHSYDVFEHGWPQTFLRRTIRNDASHGNRWAIWRGTKQRFVVPFAWNVLMFAVIGTLILWYFARKAQRVKSCTVSIGECAAVILILSLFLATLAEGLQRSRRTRRVGVLLERSGADIRYEYCGPKWLARIAGDIQEKHVLGMELLSIRDIDLSTADASKANELRMLLVELGSVHRVSIELAEWNANDMRDILLGVKGCHPQVVSLFGSNVSDEELEAIDGCERLKTLNLASTKVSTRFAELASGCPNLEAVDLSDTNISVSALRAVLEHPALREITISRNVLSKDGDGDGDGELERQAVRKGVRLLISAD